MKTQEILDPQQWAETTFGQTYLKDMRRTRRAVGAAAHMAEDSAASLPSQPQTWKDVKAVYRLLDEPDVTFEALMQPHWQQTRKPDGELASGLAGPGYDRPGFLASPQDERFGRDRRWERAWGVLARSSWPSNRTAGRCWDVPINVPSFASLRAIRGNPRTTA